MKKTKTNYNTQKGNARDRGIDFQFTFEEWCVWWKEQLGPDWMEKRGCKRGQYVMARNKDEGPYAPWNVKAITAEENITYYNKRRKPAGPLGNQMLPDEVVKAIYLDRSRYRVIAERFGVTKHRIQCIKQKHYYRKITDPLDEVG